MRPVTAAASLVAFVLAALPAGADWLVLRDGSRVETRGAWTEKGRLVVFTTAEGRLSSLRADTVDLGASRLATAETAAAAAAPAEGAPTAASRRAEERAVRRITNADIAPGAGAPPTAGAPATPDGEQPADATVPTARDLQVRDTMQEIDPVDGHLIIRGRLTNASERTAAAIELVVHAMGADGQELGTLPAALDLEALNPGASTGFQAHFFDVYSGAFGLRFAPAATFLESRAPDAAAEGEAGAGGAGPGTDTP